MKKQLTALARRLTRLRSDEAEDRITDERFHNGLCAIEDELNGLASDRSRKSPTRTTSNQRRSRKRQYYGVTRWMVGDVQPLTIDENGKPRWTEAQCRIWLENNEGYIVDRLAELGNEVISDLMPATPDGENYKE